MIMVPMWGSHDVVLTDKHLRLEIYTLKRQLHLISSKIKNPHIQVIRVHNVEV